MDKVDARWVLMITVLAPDGLIVTKVFEGYMLSVLKAKGYEWVEKAEASGKIPKGSFVSYESNRRS